mmetsp:Transcript_3392/g.8793  ORF Transcript_3392/g.8793 Transcript_3392/m.8793 type:complete len:98 (-) Transcript_3392:104-397(-)
MVDIGYCRCWSSKEVTLLRLHYQYLLTAAVRNREGNRFERTDLLSQMQGNVTCYGSWGIYGAGDCTNKNTSSPEKNGVGPHFPRSQPVKNIRRGSME